MPFELTFAAPGTYFIEDDGIVGNNSSRVRDSAGNLNPFTHPNDTLSFVCTVPGVTLIFSTVDAFATSNVVVGSLTDSSQCPDQIVVRSMAANGFVVLASNGSIVEGGADAATDIRALFVTMSAVTGIGTAANAIETRVGSLEGETNSGGINIFNTGEIRIGGLTEEVGGLQVGGSGDINLSATGSIILTDLAAGGSVIGGGISGNVTLRAIGTASNIQSDVNNIMIRAPSGGVTLDADNDVLVGTGGSFFDNDIRAADPITVHAGRDFTIDGESTIGTGFFGIDGGDIEIFAGRRISFANLTSGGGRVSAVGGDLILTTGPGGTFETLAAAPGAASSDGNIILSADNVIITSGGLTTNNLSGNGVLTIRPATQGRPINIANGGDVPDALSLSSNEIDLLFTNSLVIGDADSGPISFNSPISPTALPNISVRSGSEIFVNALVDLAGSLTLHAGSDLYVTGAGNFSLGGALNAFVDVAQAGFGGIGSLNGVNGLATTIRLTGNAADDVLTGSAAADNLQGAAGQDQLDGAAGNDVLDGGAGADAMTGGPGDDTYFADTASDDIFEIAGDGRDRVLAIVSFTLGANVEDLTLQTAAGAANGTGNAENNTITGNASANTLIGLAGADILNGAAGSDIMRGGAGDDRYIVDSATDQVVETSAADGIDLVSSSVSFTLGANVENLSLTGAAAISATGNALANSLAGNGAANTLNGLGGADIMRGGDGDDSYVVDNAGDQAIETSAAGGTDIVQSSVSFTLGSNVERLTLTGAGAINGTGNTLANLLTGNGAANILNGLGGADTMNGGNGNDTYIIDNAGDQAIETSAVGGTDTVQSAVSYTLGANVENLALTGAAATNGNGNGLANILTGNAAANVLNGLAGADSMRGGDGNDNYIVDNAGDQAIETNAAGGVDRVQSSVSFTLGANIENLVLIGAGAVNGIGNALGNLLVGNAAANQLNGLTGNDTLQGGGGGDDFLFTTALGVANIDRILDLQVGVDDIVLENAIFTAIAAGALPGSAFRQGTAATDADDRIIYDPATGALFYDSDGIGAAAAIRFATLQAGLALTAGEFEVI